MSNPKILVFAASTRTGSYNAQLAEVVSRRLEAAGAEVTRLNLADYPLPIYEGDLEAELGIPENAQRLHELLRTHDGVFLASPEYNAFVSPLLVNVLTWVSRVADHGGIPAAFGRPVFASGSASPGGFGGYRGLMALRQPLELQFQARVLPGMVSVGAAHQAFDENGELASVGTSKLVDGLVASLLAAAQPARELVTA